MLTGYTKKQLKWIADVVNYALRLSDVLQIDLETIVKEKIALNAKKYPVDQVKGSAKKYSEYE